MNRSSNRPGFIAYGLVRRIMALGLAGAFLARIPLLFKRIFDPDELQHLHMAWCHWKGLTPFVDYFDTHPPLFHLLLRGLFPVTGESVDTILLARGVMWVLGVLTCIPLYKLARLYGDRIFASSVLLLVAFTTMFVEKAIEIRPDVPALFCWLWGLYILVLAAKGGPARTWFMAGLWLGMAFAFTQKYAYGLVAILIMLAAISGHRLWRGGALQGEARRAVLLLTGLALPTVLVLFPYMLRGELAVYIRHVLFIPMHWPQFVDAEYYIYHFRQQTPLLLVLGAGGLIMMAWDTLRPDQNRLALFLPQAAMLGQLAGLLVMPVPWRQYFMGFLPVWVLGCAYLLRVMTDGQFNLRRRWQATGLGVVALLLLFWDPKGYRNHQAESHPFLVEGFLADGWLYAAILFFGLVGIAISRWRYIRASPFFWPAWGLLGLLAGVFSGLPFYVAGLLPVAAMAITWSGPDKRVYVAAILALLSVPILQFKDQFRFTNEELLDEVRYILATTQPDDPVMMGWRGSGVFRPHAYYYWFLHEEMHLYLDNKQKTDDILAAFEALRPPIVEYNWAFQMLPEPVKSYVEQHYEPAGVGVLYRCKSGPPPYALAIPDVMYFTDLYHPHQDPDDHFDLAVMASLPQVNIIGVILDDGDRQQGAPGAIPIAQINALTGRSIHGYRGLAEPLQGPMDDGRDQPAPYQEGVDFLIETLMRSTNRISVITTGSLRDLAAAYNRRPELLADKIDRIFAFIGCGTLADCDEYNVELDVHAYERVMSSGLPVFWVPCFHAGVWSHGPHGSWWLTHQGELWVDLPEPVLQYFLYALLQPDGDPVAYLEQPVDHIALERLSGELRNLWGAGLLACLFDEGWKMVGDSHVYFQEGRELLAFEPFGSGTSSVYRFNIRDEKDYGPLMTRLTAKRMRSLVLDNLRHP
jgi:hypothetical protein